MKYILLKKIITIHTKMEINFELDRVVDWVKPWFMVYGLI